MNDWDLWSEYYYDKLKVSVFNIYLICKKSEIKVPLDRPCMEEQLGDIKDSGIYK